MKFSPPKIRFSIKRIPYYADLYSYTQSEEALIVSRDHILKKGYLTKQELQVIANWKTPRTKSQISLNDDDFVKEVTNIALSTDNERIRIEVLTLLKGVSWPTASTILHFYHPGKYPIIDFRALYSINCDSVTPKDYCFDFWKLYTDYTRSLCEQSKLSMRKVDQALWQYSKLKQKL